MSIHCSGLGSLCGKISDAFTCNLCTKNVILIGTAPTQLQCDQNAGLRALVRQFDGDLHKVELTPSKNIRTLALDENAQKIGIAMAILGTARRLTASLKQADETETDAWNKYFLAEASCDLNLDNMLKASEALTKKEASNLEKAVEKVARFHLSASMLWKIYCQNDANKQKVKLYDDLSSKQVKFLKKKFRAIPNLTLNAEDFWQLDLDIQKIFLEATKYFSDEDHKMCRRIHAMAFTFRNVEDESAHPFPLVVVTPHHPEEKKMDFHSMGGAFGPSPLSMNRGTQPRRSLGSALPGDTPSRRKSPSRKQIEETSVLLQVAATSVSLDNQERPLSSRNGGSLPPTPTRNPDRGLLMQEEVRE